MYTPAQVLERLHDLGIDRDARTLTDWRQKGLLPPLRRVGLGRGLGSKQQWDDDVLEQAVAAHCLLKNYARAEEARLGLWLSGYEISSKAARRAWITHLQMIQKRRSKAASRNKDGFLGLGLKSLKNPKVPKSFSDVMTEAFEWQYDNTEIDDEDIQGRIAEILGKLGRSSKKSRSPNRELYKAIEAVWADIDFPSIFRPSQSAKFVRSMSDKELDATREALGAIRRIIQHVMALHDSTVPLPIRVLATARIMQGLVGPLLAGPLIAVRRTYPEVPSYSSIFALHDLVMSVQCADIAKKSDGRFVFSERVQIEWEATKKKLSQLWIAATDKSPIQSSTPSGPPGRTSG